MPLLTSGVLGRFEELQDETADLALERQTVEEGQRTGLEQCRGRSPCTALDGRTG